MKLDIRNLYFSYQDGENRKQIFDDLSLSFEDGVFYSVTGPSGCGKTTLLSLIGTLDSPEKGEILLDGQDIFSDPVRYRREKIGFVFQNYNLIQYMTGIENVAMAMDIAGRKIDMHQVLGTLGLIGIDEETAKKRVIRLSGGEQQRIAIARAFINNPDIILADEATGNLDSETSENIVSILSLLAHRFHKCIIMVTHNEEIAALSDIEYKIINKNVLTIHRNK